MFRTVWEGGDNGFGNKGEQESVGAGPCST